MADKLSLPASSYRQLTKIIVGYSRGSENMSLDDLVKSIGIGKTIVSPNHKFLIELGLITAGNKKSATPLGKRLGRALEYDQEDDIRSAWGEAIKGNATMSDLIAYIRIQKGRSISELSSHILYISDQRDSQE